MPRIYGFIKPPKKPLATIQEEKPRIIPNQFQKGGRVVQK
jgi:hypothetical protein